jgi:hypothetical protein
MRCIYVVEVSYIHFEWDENKSRINQKKHGVSFEEAQTVFFDPGARLIHDPDHSEQEDRFIIFGASRRLRLLLVCHSYLPAEDLIRIISARKATSNDSAYFGGI